MYRRNHEDRIAPKTQDGHLYYVRLKTEVGVFYKIGFTTFGSVEERFSFNGTGDERYIDKTLLFLHMKDGYLIEQRLHGHFSTKRAFGKYSSLDFMPLFKNGQSELYAEDVLKLDVDYEEKQAKQTLRQVDIWRAKQKHSHPALIYLDVYGAKVVGKLLGTLLGCLLLPMSLLAYLMSNKEKEDALAQSHKESEDALEALLSSIKEMADEQDIAHFRRLRYKSWLAELARDEDHNVEATAESICTDPGDVHVRQLILRSANNKELIEQPNLKYSTISDFADKNYDGGIEWFPDYEGMRFWMKINNIQYYVNVRTLDPAEEDDSGVSVLAQIDGPAA